MLEFMNEKERYFKQVYQESRDKIYRICLGFTGNHIDADDLFQEITIKVWNNLSSFRKESNINTWIYRISTNTALQYLHKRNRSDKFRRGLKSENIIIENAEYEHSDHEEQVNRLYKAISSLKEIDRIIIGLLLEENSYSEIADITGISTSNVGVRINRIKKALSKKMK